MAGRKKEDTLVAEKRGVKKYVHATYMGYHFLLRKNRRVVSCWKKTTTNKLKIKERATLIYHVYDSITMLQWSVTFKHGWKKKKEHILAAEKRVKKYIPKVERNEFISCWKKPNKQIDWKKPTKIKQTSKGMCNTHLP